MNTIADELYRRHPSSNGDTAVGCLRFFPVSWIWGKGGEGKTRLRQTIDLTDYCFLPSPDFCISHALSTDFCKLTVIIVQDCIQVFREKEQIPPPPTSTEANTTLHRCGIQVCIFLYVFVYSPLINRCKWTTNLSELFVRVTWYISCFVLPLSWSSCTHWEIHQVSPSFHNWCFSVWKAGSNWLEKSCLMLQILWCWSSSFHFSSQNCHSVDFS